jgi:hypothetical protein
MKQRLRRIRGAVGMGLTWAVIWMVAGLAIGISSKLLPGLPWGWFFEIFDAPLPALAIPGFFGGIFFSIVLGIAGRHRHFRELSLPVFAAWGALGGVLLTLFPFALDAVGLASLNVSPRRIVAGIGGPFVLLGAVSAAISLTLARRSEGHASAESRQEARELPLDQREAAELLGSGDSPLHGDRSARREVHVRPDAPDR